MFNKFPWGEVVYNDLCEALEATKNSENKERPEIFGCTVALQIWAFEKFPNIGGNLIQPTFPRLLSWSAEKYVTSKAVENYFKKSEVGFVDIKPTEEELKEKIIQDILAIEPLDGTSSEVFVEEIFDDISPEVFCMGESSSLKSENEKLKEENKRLLDENEDLKKYKDSSVAELDLLKEEIAKLNERLAKLAEERSSPIESSIPMGPQGGFLSPIGPSSPVETQKVFEEAVNEAAESPIEPREGPSSPIEPQDTAPPEVPSDVGEALDKVGVKMVTERRKGSRKRQRSKLLNSPFVSSYKKKR